MVDPHKTFYLVRISCKGLVTCLESTPNLWQILGRHYVQVQYHDRPFLRPRRIFLWNIWNMLEMKEMNRFCFQWKGTWVIFVVWLLITWLVNVAKTFTDVLKHNILETRPANFATFKPYPHWASSGSGRLWRVKMVRSIFKCHHWLTLDDAAAASAAWC